MLFSEIDHPPRADVVEGGVRLGQVRRPRRHDVGVVRAVEARDRGSQRAPQEIPTAQSRSSHEVRNEDGWCDARGKIPTRRKSPEKRWRN